MSVLFCARCLEICNWPGNIPVYRHTTADLCHIARYYSDQW